MIRLARVLLIPVVVLAVSVFLVLLAAGFIELMLLVASVLGLQHALGMDTQTSHNYAASSGTLPMVVTVLGFSSLLTGVWHHLNCVAPGCPKIGRYPDATGKKWCWSDHPDHQGKERTRETLHQLHRDAR